MKFNPLHAFAVATLATAFLALGGCAGSGSSRSGSKTFITINGQSVSEDQYELEQEIGRASYRANNAPFTENRLKEIAREEIIRRIVLEQAAREAGIDKTPAAVALSALQRQKVLIDDYQTYWIKEHPPTADELRTAYTRAVSDMGKTEYHIRHIALKEQSQAAEVISQLNKGVKFEALLAKSVDVDVKNGDLGWLPRTAVEPNVAAAIAKLTKGSYTTTPVKGPVVYHVIQLLDTRPLQAPSFDQAKSDLKAIAGNAKFSTHTDGLFKAAKVTRGKSPDVLAIVNGQSVLVTHAQFLANMMATGKQIPDETAFTNSVGRELVMRTIVEQAARAAGIDQHPSTITHLKLASQVALINVYMEDWAVRHKPTETELQREYGLIKTGQPNTPALAKIKPYLQQTVVEKKFEEHTQALIKKAKVK